jgi:hypothetical protein
LRGRCERLPVLDDSWRPGLRQLLIPATELLGSHYSSDRGACGFVQVAYGCLCQSFGGRSGKRAARPFYGRVLF